MSVLIFAGRDLPGALRARLRRLRLVSAEQPDQWSRVVMNADIARFLRSLPTTRYSAVEISGDLHRHHPWRAYENLTFPSFDLCSSTPERAYDIVICEQVLEHVADPWRAAGTLRELCRPGGYVVVSTPFLIRIHEAPADFWRFSEHGLRTILERSGLKVLSVSGWGNRACVRANLRRWARYRPWRSLRNEAAFPLVVWATAQRPSSAAESGAAGGEAVAEGPEVSIRASP